MRLNKYGRDGRIRTCDILIPNQALYQAELHPDTDWLFRHSQQDVVKKILFSYGRTQNHNNEWWGWWELNPHGISTKGF